MVIDYLDDDYPSIWNVNRCYIILLEQGGFDSEVRPVPTSASVKCDALIKVTGCACGCQLYVTVHGPCKRSQVTNILLAHQLEHQPYPKNENYNGWVVKTSNAIWQHKLL